MMRHRFAYESNEYSFADSADIDAFNRLRVSNPTTLFETQQQYGIDTLRMETGNTLDGVAPAWSANTRLLQLQIGAGAAGGSSYAQSYHYLPYQPGKSTLVMMTGIMGAATSGAEKRFGFGDSANGIFYEQNTSGGLQFNRRTSTSGGVVNNVVAQANWNLDRFDGTGPSGVTLSVGHTFILVIDLQFLGMGRIRIGFNVDGVIYYAHQFLNANVLAVPIMQTASLPVIAEILAAAGLGASATSYFKCATVMSEGGYEHGLGNDFSAEGTVTAASGARTHILSIRPRTTFNTLANRIFIRPEQLDFLGGAKAVLWELVIGAAFTVAPTWANVNATYSGCEYGVNGTFANLTNGLVIAAGYISTNLANARASDVADIAPAYPISLDRAGAQRALGTLSILVTGVGGTSDCRCSLGWSELR